MQLAHPAVAAGVVEHSDFPRRAFSRLSRTLGLYWALNFGDRKQALGAARHINQVHRGIHGDGYDASQPGPLLWVQATLIDSSLVAYETFVRSLAASQREVYYWEAQRVGRLLGIPSATYPSDLADFERYLGEMIAGPQLLVDDRARKLGAAVVRPPLRGVPGFAWAPFAAITAGLLPDRLREDYGLPWGTGQRALYGTLRRAVRRLVPLLPNTLRMIPAARPARPLQ